MAGRSRQELPEHSKPTDVYLILFVWNECGGKSTGEVLSPESFDIGFILLHKMPTQSVAQVESSFYLHHHPQRRFGQECKNDDATITPHWAPGQSCREVQTGEEF
eukprot:scaffold6860_cov162-Amphora_coffeaeformis.AAC.7